MAFYECVDKVKPFITTETVFDTVITFNDVYGNIPLVTCNSLISGYQEGSGVPSPSNVRNLVSFNSATLTENGNTHLFTFGTDIYSGYIDWEKGIVNGDKIVKTIDENTAINMGSTTVGVFQIPDFFDVADDTDSINCNFYIKGNNRSGVGGVYNSNPDLSFCCRTTDGLCYIKDTSFTSVNDYKTWLSTNPVKIAVKLAEPITIPLGGIQLLTQQGVNTYSCNTGDTTIEYINIT